MPLTIAHDVPLAPLTTFALGGTARFFAEVVEAADVTAALQWAADKQIPAFVLGGGSNLVVADSGFPGLVVHMSTRGRAFTQVGSDWQVTAQAGEPWDEVVTEAVLRNAAGIECLSGIPGSIGAAPVQNIGAYGQEVGDALVRVRVLDRVTLQTRDLDQRECGFAYRDSLFKREPGRFILLAVTLRLRGAAPAKVRYAELAAALEGTHEPSLAQVRDTVLALRRKKGMVFEPGAPGSAGSFFTNPIVPAAVADEVVERALRLGCARSPGEIPRFPLPDGRVKLAAGWLIEKAGVHKGLRMGPVGVSEQHTLALVHHGGGTTADLLRLAAHARALVQERFAITLAPEPVFLGLSWPE